MTLARALIAEIPALRRFSRALLGDISQADACLEKMLTNLLSGVPIRFPTSANGNGMPLRLNLLGNLIDSLPARLDDTKHYGNFGMEKSAQLIFQRIPKRTLIAFLLRTLESLDDDDIAYVMGISPLQAHLLVELGSASIAGEISTNVLIIDSDPTTATLLSALIRDLGHSLCGIARTADEALHVVETEQPGLMISELLYPDPSSNIELFCKLLKHNDVPFIIITRHPELWTETKDLSPAGLITKPFLDDVVRATISKALFFNKRAKAPYWDHQKETQINH
jgi:CheY-like chemotaxis protein